MIFGIGTDIVEVARIEALWSRHGERFAKRILSAGELPALAQHPAPARMLAKRFAAKEAFSKAVGTGMRHPVSFHRIGVAHDRLGKPALEFDEMLGAWLTERGIDGQHLSISDEREMVVAFVVLECR